jgi:hypothetical protein
MLRPEVQTQENDRIERPRSGGDAFKRGLQLVPAYVYDNGVIAGGVVCPEGIASGLRPSR